MTKIMRVLVLVPLFVWFSSCSSPDKEHVDEHPDAATSDTIMLIGDPVGVHRGTMPCADCPGILTEIWLGSDGTFLKLATYQDRDTVPFGEMGNWELIGNEVLLKGSSGLRFRVTDQGLSQVIPEAGGASTGSSVDLRRSDGDLLDRSMRITGRYTYADESHSMRPCGSGAEIPLGMQVAGLEMAMWYTEGGHSSTDPLLVEIQAHLGLGPSMEGDGEEVYLFVEKVLRRLDGDCPSITSPL